MGAMSDTPNMERVGFDLVRVGAVLASQKNTTYGDVRLTGPAHRGCANLAGCTDVISVNTNHIDLPHILIFFADRHSCECRGMLRFYSNW